MTGRAVPEWHGATPDAKIPDRVKLRIWERCGGRCGLSGRKLRPPADAFDYDHIKPLADGGSHSEFNLHVVSRDKHRKKTAAEATERADTRRQTMKYLGIKSSSGPKIQSGGFDKTLTKKFNGAVVPREQRR